MDTYQKNLAILRRKYPDIAEELTNLNADHYKRIVSSSCGYSNILLNGIASIYYHENDNPKNHASRYVQKVIDENNLYIKDTTFCFLVGFGCGYYLEALLQNMSWLKEIIVYEPDIEVFKLVIEKIDITQFLEPDNICFFVGDKFFADFGMPHRVHRFFAFGNWLTILPPEMITLYPDRVRKSLSLFDDTLRSLDISQRTMLEKKDYISDNFYNNVVYMACLPLVNELFGKYQGTPVVCVSPGPSLMNYLDFLKEIQNKALLICVDAALPVLVKNGIKPHFVAAMEPTPRKFNWFLENADNTSGINLICGYDTYYKLLDVWQGSKLLALSGRKNFADVALFLDTFFPNEDKLPPAYTVALLCFAVAKEIGGSPIILVGQDLSYGVSGTTHAPGATNAVSIDYKPDEKNHALVKVAGQEVDIDIVTVKDYDGNDIPSNMVFAFFISIFEKYNAEQPCQVYNLTEKGACIRGIPRVAVSDIACYFQSAIQLNIAAGDIIEKTEGIKKALAHINDVIESSYELEKWISLCKGKLETIGNCFDKYLFLEEQFLWIYKRSSFLYELILVQIPELVYKYKRNMYKNIMELSEQESTDYLYSNSWEYLLSLETGIRKMRANFQLVVTRFKEFGLIKNT